MNRKLERSTELAETLLLDLLLSKQSKSLIIVTRSEKEAKQFFSTLRSSVERLTAYLSDDSDVKKKLREEAWDHENTRYEWP